MSVLVSYCEFSYESSGSIKTKYSLKSREITCVYGNLFIQNQFPNSVKFRTEELCCVPMDIFLYLNF